MYLPSTSLRGSRSNYCCRWLYSSSTSVDTWIGKPAVFKWTLVPFTNIVKCTSHQNHPTSKNWVIEIAAVHYLPSPLQAAEGLFNNMSSTNHTVIKTSLPVGVDENHHNTSLVWKKEVMLNQPQGIVLQHDP